MKKLIPLILSSALFIGALHAQTSNDTVKKEGYIFTVVKENSYTSVKNQNKSGTCWCFSTLAFFESELLRTGKGEYDLSEMFVVRNTYFEKTEKYVRFHGNMNYGAGGAAHDVPAMIKKYGIVPEEVYKGLEYGEGKHVHSELDNVLTGVAKTIANEKKPSTAWKKAVNGILDAYLGVVPKEFTYKNKKYTPVSFAQSLGLNWDDYIEIGSFTHHPFYEQFLLEVPDNWMFEKIYNVPLDEMMQIIDDAIASGYTVAWGADVSEKGFSRVNGVAVVPDENKPDLRGTEQERWEKLSEKEKAAELYTFEEPLKEKTITQEMRQAAFDNFETTDDHGMQIVGTAKDQNGTKYYIVKNSWGTDHLRKGIFYASEAFVRYKTIDILVNKNCLNKNIKAKLKL